jgi:hypothetical protein
MIYSNDFLTIIEDKNKAIFKMELAYPNAPLIRSLIKTGIIIGGTTTPDYKSIKFKASSVKPLKKFQEEQKTIKGTSRLSINEVSLLIFHLTNQLDYLITKENRTILGYNPENIIVINDQKFAFLAGELITEIEDNNILISYPFLTSDFYVSPELLEVTNLPSSVHYKTTYFSLACLVVHVLLYDNEFYIDFLKYKNPERIIESLNTHPIKKTKMYWLLSRCLVEEADKRSILLI